MAVGHNGQENTNSTRHELGLCVRVLVYFWTKCLSLRDVHRVQSADGANAADMGCNVLKDRKCTKNPSQNRLDDTGTLYLEVRHIGERLSMEIF